LTRRSTDRPSSSVDFGLLGADSERSHAQARQQGQFYLGRRSLYLGPSGLYLAGREFYLAGREFYLAGREFYLGGRVRST
jgi:hypothetical protein